MTESLLRFKLIRKYYEQDGTIGKLLNDRGIMQCYALERPKIFQGIENAKDNSKTFINESCCIPEGVYTTKRTYSSTFRRTLFLVDGVDGREGIRIHAANVIDQLLGCIAPATTIQKDVRFRDKVYPLFASQSAKALAKIEAILPDIFVLEITS